MEVSGFGKYSIKGIYLENNTEDLGVVRITIFYLEGYRRSQAAPRQQSLEMILCSCVRGI